MISALIHTARLTRALYVFAREGVFGFADPSTLPPQAQLAIRMARLIERRGAATSGRLSRALTRLGPTIRETRPVPRYPSRRGRRCDGTGPRESSGSPAAFPAGASGSCCDDSVRPAAVAGVRKFQRTGCRGIDCAGSPRRDRKRRCPQDSRREGAAPQRPKPLPPRPSARCSLRPATQKHCFQKQGDCDLSKSWKRCRAR